jgi:hypothetical protein
MHTATVARLAHWYTIHLGLCVSCSTPCFSLLVTAPADRDLALGLGPLAWPLSKDVVSFIA